MARKPPRKSSGGRTYFTTEDLVREASKLGMELSRSEVEVLAKSGRYPDFVRERSSGTWRILPEHGFGFLKRLAIERERAASGVRRRGGGSIRGVRTTPKAGEIRGAGPLKKKPAAERLGTIRERHAARKKRKPR
jgi:hypothetical protein